MGPFLPSKQQIYALWQEVTWEEPTPLETESFHIYPGYTAPYCLELLAVNLTCSVTTIWQIGNHTVNKRKASWLAGYGVMDTGPQQASCPAVRTLELKGKRSFCFMQNLTLKLVDRSWESSVLKAFWKVAELKKDRRHGPDLFTFHF